MGLTEATIAAAVERHVPELVLYPEISTHRRDLERGPRWRDRERGRRWVNIRPAHINEDYHPRSVELTLDHSVIPKVLDWRARLALQIWRRGRPKPEWVAANHLDDLAALRAQDRTARIDIFSGIPQNFRGRFWHRYHRILDAPGETDGRPGRDRYPVTAYARVIHASGIAENRVATRFAGLVVIQYWLFYVYNDWANTHEGDWEHVDVVLREDADGLRPVAAACSAHSGGFRLKWDDVDRVRWPTDPEGSPGHPVVHVAAGSHANYFTSGHARFENIQKFLGLIPSYRMHLDYTKSQADGSCCRPEVVRLDDDALPAWATVRLYWGAIGLARGPLKFLSFSSGPSGPNLKPAWEDPFTWVDGCRDPDGAFVASL